MQRSTRRVLDLFAGYGHLAYGENVNQRDHALQCAGRAEEESAVDLLVAAALLHDVGHLLAAAEDEPAVTAYGARDHERVGAEWLYRQGFPRRLADLVAGHVAAKRYLVATDPSYAQRLSGASRITLEQFQGGPMDADEIRAFEAHPNAVSLLALRRWDDEAKREHARTGEVAEYVGLLDRVLEG